MAETRGNAVKLVSTTYAVFSSLETKSPDTLYFITDQHQLYKGADLYGSNVSLGTEAPSAVNNPIDGLYIQESGTVGSAKNYKLFYNNGSEQLSWVTSPVPSSAAPSPMRRAPRAMTAPSPLLARSLPTSRARSPRSKPASAPA